MTEMKEPFAFSAAHHLPTFPDGHKCRRVHGHTWLLVVFVEVHAGPDGYAFDHGLLRKAVCGVIAKIDHRLINDVDPRLARGLSEDLLEWFAAEIQDSLVTLPVTFPRPRLTRVELTELSGGSSFTLTEHTKIWTA